MHYPWDGFSVLTSPIFQSLIATPRVGGKQQDVVGLETEGRVESCH